MYMHHLTANSAPLNIPSMFLHKSGPMMPLHNVASQGPWENVPKEELISYKYILSMLF